MPNSPTISEFWDTQAADHGGAPEATSPDIHYRKLEIAQIKAAMGGGFSTVLDVGCGNGYSTLEFAKTWPDATFVGVDKSAKMIEEARKAALAAGITNVWFCEGDVLELTKNKEIDSKFDIVLSERCLINLQNFAEQKLGILEMRRMLNPDGLLILVENTQVGLANLNRMRAKFGLDEIKTRWHNHYLPDKELHEFLMSVEGKLLQGICAINIGNMYYILSRVVYAKLAKDRGEEIDYNNPINVIAADLPTFGNEYMCSPNFMFVFRNIE